MSGLSTGLQNLGGTAFLAHPAAKATVDGLVTMLTGWSKLRPKPARPRRSRAGMTCAAAGALSP